MMKVIQDDIYQAVAFYYELAKQNYPNLSSFAIVTDESFETFLFAVNADEFFDDLKNEKIADEDYWNTSEWQNECFHRNAFNINIKNVKSFLEDYDNHIEKNEFLEVCLNALQAVHDDKRICMFVHITDFAFDKKLHDIVKTLNGDEIAECYQKYHTGY